MDPEWVTIDDDSWRKEIKPYLERLRLATGLNQDIKDKLKGKWPGVFWPNETSGEAERLAILLVLYAVNMFTSCIKVREVVADQWEKGIFIVVPLNTRFVYEIWGAIHFSRIILSRLIEHDDVEREQKIVNRLTQGARSDVMLPWGDLTNEQSYSVMEFIRCLKDVYDEATETYYFLCEAAHPNFVQSKYFEMAGPPAPNWSNHKFKEHAHTLLEKTLAAFEKASYGMELDVLNILGNGENYINNQRKK